MLFLANAFSINMFPADLDSAEMSFGKVTVEQARLIIDQAGGFTSIVGHQDAANVYGNVLGVPVAMNRTTFSLESGYRLLVGQYKGPRLPEGATSLPEGATIEWWVVS